MASGAIMPTMVSAKLAFIRTRLVAFGKMLAIARGRFRLKGVFPTSFHVEHDVSWTTHCDSPPCGYQTLFARATGNVIFFKMFFFQSARATNDAKKWRGFTR